MSDPGHDQALPPQDKDGGHTWMSPSVAKTFIALGLFCGTMLFAVIPVVLSRRSRGRRTMVRHVLTGLSCLGGGVFLATCFLHLLPEAVEKMEDALKKSGKDYDFPVANAIVIAGFLLVLLLEQGIHTFTGSEGHSHAPPGISEQPHLAAVPHYGSIRRQTVLDSDTEAQENGEVGGTMTNHVTSKDNTVVVHNGNHHLGTNEAGGGANAERNCTVVNFTSTGEENGAAVGIRLKPPSSAQLVVSSDDNVTSMSEHSGVDGGLGEADTPDEEDQMTTISMHGDPGVHSSFRAIVMVFALSLHSIFEGMAIGLQDSTQEVVQLFGAIIVHKCVIAVTLATSLVSASTHLGYCTVFSCLIVFAAMSPIGIGIAISLDSAPLLVNGVLQCIAAGTFVYITFFEILPHELNSRHTAGSRLFKIVMLLAGIALIITIMLLFPDQD